MILRRRSVIATMVVTIALSMSSVALADSAGGLQWKTPAGWTQDAPRPMRVATYKVAAAKGDTESAECAVFYFGQGQGGGVDDNLKRWYGQFVQPAGKSSESIAKTKKKTINGFPVTMVELTGTYTASMGPMSPTKTEKPGYRLLGAIVEGPEGAIFFKFTGPQKTVEAARADFDKMISTVAK